MEEIIASISGTHRSGTAVAALHVTAHLMLITLCPFC